MSRPRCPEGHLLCEPLDRSGIRWCPQCQKEHGPTHVAQGRGSNEGQETYRQSRAARSDGRVAAVTSHPARSVRRMALSLPLPPIVANNRRAHYMAEHKEKNKYRAECWAAAVLQRIPTASPPDHVTAFPLFRVWNKMDDDNASSALKYVLDTFSLKQKGRLHWRGMGWSAPCGYWVDDDPKHLTVEKPVQVIDRKYPGLVLELIWEG